VPIVTFKEFIDAYADGSVENYPSWRSYDIERMVRTVYHIRALKALGLAYAGELGLSEVAHRYGLASTSETRRLLGMWWVLSQIEGGHRVHLRSRHRRPLGVKGPLRLSP